MMEKNRISDNKKVSLKFKKIIKKQKLQEAGITLIALVVTIIILLILAGVTLNIALSDNGLIKKSQESTEKYKQAQNEEEKSLGDLSKLLYSDYIGAYVTGYNPEKVTEEKPFTIETQTSGTNSDQQFTTDKDMQWRIWDYDGENLKLISDKPTTEKLKLSGEAGYNNGVYVINELCRQCYTDKNIKGVEVRNLRRSDIQKVSSHDYIKFKHIRDSSAEDFSDITEENKDNFFSFGQSFEYDVSNTIPSIWLNYDSKWSINDDKECILWENENVGENLQKNEVTDGKITASETYYSHIYKTNEFITPTYYDLIFGSTDEEFSGKSLYWLAGRCVHLHSTWCVFGVQDIRGYDDLSFSMNAYQLVSSNIEKGNNGIWTYESSIRPIVSINLESAGYELVKSTNEGYDFELKQKS